MIEREFEDYLALLRGLLRLRKTQCDAIADELRDHMDARLEDLLAEGIPRERAVQIALEEFGDAAGVGQAFLELNRNNQRRWNMKVTAASLLSCTALGLLALAIWPDSGDQLASPVLAQAGGAGSPGAGLGGPPGMAPQQIRTKEENNAITAAILSRSSDEGIEIDNLPLKEAVDLVRQGTRTDFNLIFDKQKLEESNVDVSSPISLTLYRGVRFETMLELMLKGVGAGYYIHDGIVIVTSLDALAAVTEVRVYNVADLVYLDSAWPLDPMHGRGGPMGGMGGPGASASGMGMGMGMGMPGGMGPGGMGPGGMMPGGPGGRYNSGGDPYGGGVPGGKVGGPPGGIGGIGGGGPPGGIGGPPPGGTRGGQGAPGAGGGVPGAPPGSGGGVPGFPGGPGGAGPGGVSAPGEEGGLPGSGEAPSGIPGSGSTTSVETLKSILAAPQEFLAQAGMMGGGMGLGGGFGGGGEGGGGGMVGPSAEGSPPKYFSKEPSSYTPDERRAVDLIHAITSAVETSSWMENGGEGEIRPFEGLLIIRNTPKAHQGIDLLLQQIRAARYTHQGGVIGGMPPGMGGGPTGMSGMGMGPGGHGGMSGPGGAGGGFGGPPR